MPKLLAVAGRLSREGWLHSIGDARDLVQEFYVDPSGWAQVGRKFDPARGSFEAFTLGFFWRYAKGLLRRHASLAGRTALEPIEDLPAVELSEWDPADLARVRAAFRKLPLARRRVLKGTYVDELSTREVGRTLGIGRYRAREEAAEALAALAASVGATSPLERQLAIALFVDGETLEVAAQQAGLTVQRVRAVRHGLLRRFSTIANNASE